jgi:hypothetical protein
LLLNSISNNNPDTSQFTLARLTIPRIISPDVMYQTDPYARPISVVSGIWDGSRPVSAAFPYQTPTGLVGYAPTVYNVSVPSTYNSDTEYDSQSDLTHINYHAGPFLRLANDLCPRFPTAEMGYVRVEKYPEASVPLTTNLRAPRWTRSVRWWAGRSRDGRRRRRYRPPRVIWSLSY